MKFVQTLMIISIFLLFSPELTLGSDDFQFMPNIILIFTDDQGYADVGCFGAEGFSTPNLDKLAEQGILFTNFYSAASICTPSRAALLTGCYPPRIGITKVAFPEGPPWTKDLSNFGLHEKELTIAEMLKPLGYATACIGKWHLGHRPAFLPDRHGFDKFYGLPYSNDMRPANNPEYPDLPLLEDDRIVELNPDQTLLTKLYTEKAVEFITVNKDKPFFLYLPHTMPHVPIYSSDKFRGYSNSGVYGDVISEIDWSIGEIVKKVEELGLTSRTLFIFTSDNGPWLEYGNHGGSAGILREGKFTTFEGGQRVPCIIKWEGVFPDNIVSDQIISTLDILPTIAAITGAELSQNKIDGLDMSQYLVNPEENKSPRKIFYFYSDVQLQAIRYERWKLHIPHKYASLKIAGQDGQIGQMVEKETDWELYNLDDDPGEKINLAKNHPKIVDRLAKMILEFEKDLSINKRPAGRY